MRISRFSMPLDYIRDEKYARIEPGILPAVKALIRSGAVPVWSCEGHPHSREPTSVWFPPETWRLIRGKPFVICAGPRFSSKTTKGAICSSMRLLDDGRGPLRLIYLRVPKTPSGAFLLHKVRWCRTARFYAIVFADQRSVLTLQEQEGKPR